MQTFEKGGANLRVLQGGGDADFEAKIRGVNSVSGENLHDFEIICPAREKRGANAPRTPLPTGLYLTSNHSELFSRDTQHWYNDHLFVRSQFLSLTYLKLFCCCCCFLKVINDQKFYLV